MAKELFYNLDDMDQGLARKLGEGINTRIFVGDRVMISVVRIDPDAEGQIHSHPEEQWGLLIEGECVRIQDGEEIACKKGDFWRTPGGVEHGLRAGPHGATVMDIFSPPRGEYRKPGEGFGS